MKIPGQLSVEINTLTIQRKLRLVPNDNRVSNNAPAFRVMLGWQAIGEAWEKQSRSDPPREYLRVRIDDPLCPISAALFPDDEGLSATMVMNVETGGQKRRDYQAGKPGDGG
ncbi:MAG: DUF736 domain-containing protein [Sphingomonadaceae bacterium]